VVLGLLHSWCALPLGLTLHTLTRMILRLLDARRLRALANLACLLGRRLPALARRFALLIGLSLAIHVFALLQSFTLLHGLALLHTFTHLSVAILSNTI
jgi:hypothetical protein